MARTVLRIPGILLDMAQFVGHMVQSVGGEVVREVEAIHPRPVQAARFVVRGAQAPVRLGLRAAGHVISAGGSAAIVFAFKGVNALGRLTATVSKSGPKVILPILLGASFLFTKS